MKEVINNERLMTVSLVYIGLLYEAIYRKHGATARAGAIGVKEIKT